MELNEKDFILYRENNQIKSGGYSVNSILLNKNSPAVTTYNQQNGGGSKKVSEIFSNLAVPAGLFYGNEKNSLNTLKPIIVNNDTVLPDSIHDQLLELLEPTQKQLYNIKTKKRNLKIKKRKKTRRAI
tara:strand:- start:346 stop:729 length:384 start_codon:yes stop_codon:yes gene_type:complete